MNNVSSPLPTTTDLLGYYAQNTPDKVALRSGAANTCTFAQLQVQVVACTAYLQRSLPTLAKGQVVAVCADDFVQQWISLLALENLGYCSMTVLPGEVGPALVEQFAVGALLAHEEPAVLLAVPVLVFSAQALSAQTRPAIAPPFQQDRQQNTVLRLLRTSGTTGTAKRIALDRRMWDGWIERWQWLCGYGAGSVCLVQHHFSIGGIYATATACLRAGGTVVKRDGRSFLQALHDFGVSHATTLPMDLASVTGTRQQLPVLQRKIMLTAFGGVLPPDTVAQCLQSFAHRVVDMYGTNEVGFIGVREAAHDEDIASGIALWPGVEVAIVNDEDVALPPGEMGHIKVRTPHMSERYEGESEATASHFVNGWFWPGDLGHLLPNGRLLLAGRKDDLINVGGIKVNPAFAEDNLRSLDYVEDAAVLTRSGANGAQILVIAVVFKATGRMERLQKEIAPGMAALGHLVEWAQVERIPRTPTGKIQRAELRAQLRDKYPSAQQP